ncbi:DUF58 domain-containing protein [Sphingomonas sp. S1-29]|uniref:DUF58 domain-containing protein n=1 Tax=Sphingomonas sp. S1-29 TaxID=2991074 RepID=UPI00223EEBE8|nr:DUF58 domain-containing protein [Sphingomonas sp. S1-29]UZK70527.1 DUF58 domain-containing protein [Sphingomonas sp. S1-29]
MIYPTQRAAMLVAVAAPVALALGVAVPGGWVAAIGWVVVVVAAVFVDGLLAPSLAGAATVDAPAMVPVGGRVLLAPAIAGGVAAEFAAEVSAPLERTPHPLRVRAELVEAPSFASKNRTALRQAQGERGEDIPQQSDGSEDGALSYTAPRRGTARVSALWARRRGPLGFAWRQRKIATDTAIRVVPDIRPTREQGMRQYLRSTQFGSRMRTESGDGQEFQALTDFQPGMQRRAIDWKASARHLSLQAREYRTERDHAVVLAIDSGRAMADPVEGVPRVDRAVSAALLAAFVALKSGDRVRLFGFAARPQVDSGSLTGARSFANLHAHAADIDYGTGESNYTLSLTALDQRLDRRSLVVIFTEFTDPTAAELLLAAGQRLLKRHRVLFVLFHDVELEGFVAARPASADDVTHANVAQALLRERRIVIERVKRLGIELIEADPHAMPLVLVERYLALRERG